MARKTSNTWLWIAALGVGGYLLYKNGQTATAQNSTAPGASTGILNLPPSVALNTNLPASNIAASNAPSPATVNTTNLVPAQVTANNVPVLQPGQSIALNANLTPVMNSQGIPMVFESTNTNKAVFLSALGAGTLDEGECL